MPSVKLDSGIVFAYVDSGAPTNDASYATVIILHGLGFGSNTFLPLFPLATAAKLRIVGLNWRGYGGSSPYTAAELDVIAQGTSAQRAEFLEQQGALLAGAVAAIVEELRLPADGKLGVLAWSLGNVWLHALLAQRAAWEKRLTHVILLDPASQGLGLPDPEDAWNPYKDPSYPPGDLPKYNSGYYAHAAAGGAYEYRTWLADPAPTSERMPLADLLGPVDDAALAAPAFAPLLHDLARRALAGRTVHALVGERTLWMCIFAVRVLEQWAAEDSSERGLRVKSTVLPGCNHFPMWDAPGLLIEHLVAVLGNE